MKFAIVGCAHGELEKIYETVECLENREQFKVDVILCCGDFQSTRNTQDMNCMAIPKKFHNMCSFYKYHNGEKVAPILTIFIGGNHEASNYLQELPYGGWVATNIYYMGYAGVLNINGIRIGGISGIFKGYNYFRGHYEISPYDQNELRSVYHIRQLEVFRLQQIQEPMDIFLSHEWPTGVSFYGDAETFLANKSFFRDEVNNNTLGCDKLEELLHHLQPNYWFSAHLHCKFAAVVPHKGTTKQTKFLALDKCLPGRNFLQILDIEGQSNVMAENEIRKGSDNTTIQFEYDLEWLTILNRTNHLLTIKRFHSYMPREMGKSTERFNFTPTAEEKEMILKKFNENLAIEYNFVRTADSYYPTAPTPTPTTSPSSSAIVEDTATDSSTDLGNQIDEISLINDEKSIIDDDKIIHNNDKSINLNDTYGNDDEDDDDDDDRQPAAILNNQTIKLCDTLGIDDPIALLMLINYKELNYSNFTDTSDDLSTSVSNTITDTSADDGNTIHSFITDIPQEQSMNSSNPSAIDIENIDDDDDEKNNKLWFVDTKSSNAGSKTTDISFDKHQMALEWDEENGSNPNGNTSTDRNNRTDEEDDEKLKQKLTLTGETTKTIFKRRNQNIYGSGDDGD